MTDDRKKNEMERRSKELAQRLLDTLEPSDPKRVAERAAFEAEKEREDKAALEDFYVRTGQTAPEQIKRARSIHEMHFAASLAPCPKCGTRIGAEQLHFAVKDEAWALTGDCPRCGTPRAFTFRTYGDPLTAPTPRDELGGPQPSEIISPSRWIAEIDRLLPLLRADPKQLGIDEWKANRDANQRLLVTLNELVKFVPAGATEIPTALLDADEDADRGARPERYQRVWIEEQRAHVLELRARNVADLPRIENLERGGKAAATVVELDRAALRAHEKWIEGGKRGKGRLVLAGTSAIGAKLGPASFAGAELEDVDFTDADLGYATFDGAQLRNVRCTDANLASASFKGAKIDGGTFTAARLQLAKLDDTEIDGATFGEADFDRSQWHGAKIVRARFDGAEFGNAELDGATFVRCDFRRANFAPTSPRPNPTTRGTRFEDCDLRGTRWEGRDLSGAEFIRCKLDGILGRPAAADDIEIEDPDLSLEGDGSDIASAEEVLAIWFPERNATY
jgi:uncharacterized protein YjbI with pentapeptide repeats